MKFVISIILSAISIAYFGWFHFAMGIISATIFLILDYKRLNQSINNLYFKDDAVFEIMSLNTFSKYTYFLYTVSKTVFWPAEFLWSIKDVVSPSKEENA